MAGQPLTVVTRTQGNNAAFKDGRVRARADVAFVEVPVIVQAFRRMVRTLEFDVCEMAFTTYLCAKEHGVPFTALPVFLARGFHHGAIGVRAGGPVRSPSDLAGREVGVNRGYTVTTGVWARAILAHEHGIDLDAVTWRPSGDEHVASYQPPPNVIPLALGPDLLDRVKSGELAAEVGVDVTAEVGVDVIAEVGAEPSLVTLIPDAAEAGYRALTERGHYPINHLIVVRDDVLDARPGLAADLFEAFASAKTSYVEGLRHGAAENATDRMYARVMELTGADPLPYGIAPNRAVIDELLDAATDQRILAKRPDIESLFAPGTHDLVG